jgi:hypothetical protein
VTFVVIDREKQRFRKESDSEKAKCWCENCESSGNEMEMQYGVREKKQEKQ